MDSDVQFVGILKDSASKKSNFVLAEGDVKVIENGERLTDHIIGAAHSILRKQFHGVGGMEKLTLGLVDNFSIQRGEFAQILYTGSSHWVLASTNGCSNPAEVNLYNSLFRSRIPMSVKKQIASLVYEEGKKFKIIVPRVQRQNDRDDCGVFAITFFGLSAQLP